jgi:hypothetical protein
MICALAKLSFGGGVGEGGGGGGGALFVRLYPNEVRASESLLVIVRRHPLGIAGSIMPI